MNGIKSSNKFFLFFASLITISLIPSMTCAAPQPKLSAPTINTYLAPTTEVTAGYTISLSISASATGGGTLSYQWQTSPTGLDGSFTNISGAINSTYTSGILDGTYDGFTFRVIVTNSRSGYQSSARTSDTVLTVNLLTQSISITSIGTNSKNYPYSQSLNISTSGSSGSGSKSYSVTDGTATNCQLDGGSTTLSSTPLLTSSTSGTCLITATIDPDNYYGSATTSASTFTFNRASQSISSPVLSASSKNYPYSQSPLTVSSVTGGSGTGALSITSVANGTASVCTWNGTTLTSTSAGTCILTITKAQDDNYNAATTTATFTFIAGPTITSFTPLTFKAGDTVTINGSNLSSATVSFAGTAATSISGTDSQIKVQVPSGTQSGKISVTKNGVTSTSVATFTISTATVTVKQSCPSGLSGTSSKTTLSLVGCQVVMKR